MHVKPDWEDRSNNWSLCFVVAGALVPYHTLSTTWNAPSSEINLNIHMKPSKLFSLSFICGQWSFFGFCWWWVFFVFCFVGRWGTPSCAQGLYLVYYGSVQGSLLEGSEDPRGF